MKKQIKKLEKIETIFKKISKVVDTLEDIEDLLKECGLSTDFLTKQVGTATLHVLNIPYFVGKERNRLRKEINNESSEKTA